jgi:hypothetical protein
MKRRELLKGLLALPVVGAFSGCHSTDKDDDHNHDNDYSKAGSAQVTTLRIMLQGPFAVVLRRDAGYRIAAYVPYDQHRDHEFRFQTPYVPEARSKSYQFKLLERGLDISHERPYIDHGFDDFNVEVETWTPNPGDNYVALDLPAPHVISYAPPPEPVLFDTGGQGTAGSLPLNHILEYRVRDLRQVKMESPQLGDRAPLSCDELHAEYLKLWKETKEAPVDREFSRRSHIDHDLKLCSQSTVSTYFFGVGLPPPDVTGPDAGKFKDHPKEFFNGKLLPSIYGKNIPPGKTLKAIGAEAVRCNSAEGVTTSSPQLVSAFFKYPVATAPRLLMVASTENCTSPGATATAGATAPLH